MTRFGCYLSVPLAGIAFDAFGTSESLARQATATSLSVYTIGLASSAAFGGIVYDNAGWTGVATYHISCTALLTLLFVLQPGCRRSFVATFCGKAEETEETQDSMTDVVPSGPVLSSVGKQDGEPTFQLPGAVDDTQPVELSAEKEQSLLQSRGTQMSDVDRTGRGTQMSDVGQKGRGTQMSDVDRTGRGTQMSDVSQKGRGTQMSDVDRTGRGTQMSDVGQKGRGTKMSDVDRTGRGTQMSDVSQKGRGTQKVEEPKCQMLTEQEEEPKCQMLPKGHTCQA